MRRWFFLGVVAACATSFAPAHGQGVSSETGCVPPVLGQGMGVVVGVVREAVTQVPVGFVDVRMIPADSGGFVQAVRSHPSGGFEFCHVPPGRYRVEGYLQGVGGDLQMTDVGPGEAVRLTLDLNLAADEDLPGSLSGRVLDADSGEPIPGVSVQIVDPERRVITDDEGRFSFPVLLPDTVEVLATHVGYQDSRGSVAIGGAQAVTIQVDMARRVIPMDPIVVTATRREFTYALPGMQELDQRMKGGFGEFILPDQIQDRNPGRVTDLLYGTKVTVVNNGKAIYMSRTLCAPVVYIDDVRFTHGYASGGLQSIARSTPEEGAFQPGRGIDAQGEDDEGVFAAEAVNLVPPSDIAAIEIYPGPGSTPGQYIDSRSRCGVILIWTRRGPKG